MPINGDISVKTTNTRHSKDIGVDSIMVSSISVIPTIRCTKAQHMKNTENLWNWIGVILLQCNSMSLNTVSIWYIEITSVLYGGPGLNISGYGSKIIIVP